MQDKLVSVAIATYNGEKFLREQLDSIYNQTYKNIEVLICDDCSTDKTIEILEEYQQKYGLIYYINEKKLGINKNFEKALGFCRGDLIALCDQDDVWEREKLEVLVREIGSYSLIHSDAKIIDKNGGITFQSHKEVFKIKKFAQNSNKYAGKVVSCVWGCTSLIKREVLKTALPFPYKFSHDFWIGFVAKHINGLKYLDEKLIYWRNHGNNNSVKRSPVKKFFLKLFGIPFRKLRYVFMLLILKKRLL